MVSIFVPSCVSTFVSNFEVYVQLNLHDPDSLRLLKIVWLIGGPNKQEK